MKRVSFRFIIQIIGFVLVVIGISSQANASRFTPSHDLFHQIEKVSTVSLQSQAQPWDPANGPSPIVLQAIFTSEDVAAFIPTNLNQNEKEVGKKIMDRSLSTLTKRLGKKNRMVRAAAALNEQIQTDFSFGSSASPEAFQHRIQLRMNAFQSQAEIRYDGYVKANLVFNYSSGTADLEINPGLTETGILTLRQLLNPEENKSYVQFNLPL